MAKHVIIQAMEEVFGEYILNLSKDNLRIAVVKGEIKLDDVQLDGDLVGSHFFGPVGLSSFGVLSCSAKSVRIYVPWNQLEKEPTKFEVEGVHLVCVPLTPTTANQVYGVGTAVDPRCTLKTRAKRLTLARFERHFWNGLIPGEGPPLKRVKRAAKEFEREMRKSGYNKKQLKFLRKNRAKSSMSTKSSTTSSNTSVSDTMSQSDEDAIDHALDTLVHGLRAENSKLVESVDIDDNSISSSPDKDGDLPNLPRDWKVKLREKVLRNLEASMKKVHIRCEVPQNEFFAKGNVADDRSCAFGFTLDSLVVRTASENWKVGSHDTRNPVDGTVISSAKDHLGPNEYVVSNNKIGYFSNLSLYWDDAPPFLLAETDALQGNYLKHSADKILSRVTAAMEALYEFQEPGGSIRQSLGVSSPINLVADQQHCYICKSLDAEVRVRTSDRTRPGPMSCSADVLPFNFSFTFLPNHFSHYNRLKAAMLSQQRFDTMMRPRPSERPVDDPRSWWIYAISCVMSHPNSRPWNDVLPIVKNRQRYIDLVMRKNSRSFGNYSFHSGLSNKESEELLELEELLPIEALLAFHKVALRRMYAKQNPNASSETEKMAKPPKDPSEKLTTPTRNGRFRFLRLPTGRVKNKLRSDTVQSPVSDVSLNSVSDFDSTNSVSTEKSISLLEAMDLRLGKKIWFVDWKLHDAVLSIGLQRELDSTPMVRFILRAEGSARSFGIGKRDFRFDISQFDVLHYADKVLFVSPINEESMSEVTPLQRKRQSKENIKSQSAPDMKTPSSFLDLPPPGSVCRIVFGKDVDVSKLSISAHPATLVWTTSLFRGLTNFISEQPPEVASDLTVHVRNAATPLARKAQLALLSPAAFSLHFHIVAPKVWVPLASSDNEGTLFMDAGTVKIASIKSEGETEADWEFHVRDMGVTFVRGIDPSRLRKDGYSYFRTYGTPFAPIGRNETSVVKPLSIDATSRSTLEKLSTSLKAMKNVQNSLSEDPARYISIKVSPVCLNLVDAEMLARSFGKWYGIGLSLFRRRVQSRVQPMNLTNTRRKVGREEIRLVETMNHRGVKKISSLIVEKLEVALEGHSKKLSSSFDERSIASQESILDAGPPTRAYLVEIFEISLRRTSLLQTATTNISIKDASIVRMKDTSLYHPFKTGRDVVEWENCVLLRSSSYPNDIGTFNIGQYRNNQNTKRPILRATLCHNRFTHLDEVEVEVDSIVLRVTPTTLKDCAKAFRRIAEIAQLVTKEMERKVHEEGRKARHRQARDFDGSVGSKLGYPANSTDHRPVSPTMSEAMTDISAFDNSAVAGLVDSSILFRITVKECTLLAGQSTTRPASSNSPRWKNPSFIVVQLISNALIMFQSIENPDASGSKTLHISVDNVSALINTEFKRVALVDSPPMIEPTGFEFRIVYATENCGCVVSQDISLDCEAVKACLTPNDLAIIIRIARTMYDRSLAFTEIDLGSDKMSTLASLTRYQKKGTGIATRIRAEIQTFSFVLLKAYKSYSGAPEFLDFNIKTIKLVIEGCLSALTGECTSIISVNFFNSNVTDWEYAVEPFRLAIGMEQMPNELAITASPLCPVQLNLTGMLLRDISEVHVETLRHWSEEKTNGNGFLDPSTLSTVGLRRASESRSVQLENLTGLDLCFRAEYLQQAEQEGLLQSGSACKLKYSTQKSNANNFSMSLRLAPSAIELIGEREPVVGLSISPHGTITELYVFKPTSPLPVVTNEKTGILHYIEGRSSPAESMLTDMTVAFDWGYYNAEPVVEWCMENQRIKPSITDLFSIPKGRDLLSNTVWSPADDGRAVKHESGNLTLTSRQSMPEDTNHDSKVNKSKQESIPSYWVSPYLADDSPEWTDLTCMLRMSRERFMLPDNRWMWINHWSVDLTGKLGSDTDADGWSYAADFETFSNSKRYYERGAACRRRRWTRTRMLKPPKMNDPFKPVKFVWENFKEDNGCISVRIRSHVRICNNTSHPLLFFAYSPSWGEDVLVETTPGSVITYVPILYAAATHLRIAKKVGIQESVALGDCLYSDRFMIVPTSHSSSRFDRTCIDLKDVSSTTLHFLIEVRSVLGIVDIVVEPVFRIFNLLPCQLECNVGEIIPISVNGSQKASIHIKKTESLTIQSGKVADCTAASPWLKPHLSLRVPGYKWSAWRRIVNRNMDTWRPLDSDEDLFFASKSNGNVVDEIKTIIRFDRVGKNGDPLNLIVCVEFGHSPIVRIFAQFWILDKTGFGCRFSEGFSDLLGSVPDLETSRRSYLSKEHAKDPQVRADLMLPGHQWSIGQSGMTMYFSKRERLSLAIENGITQRSKRSAVPTSKWISPLDVSNVIPKTVFSVDELNGMRKFELSINVTLCPGVFARTKMITLLPRYQIVNLLHRELWIAQDGYQESELCIPPLSSVHLHWDSGALEPKVRLRTGTLKEKAKKHWTNGCVQVNKIGITSMRLPMAEEEVSSGIPMVVQAEVRLATQDQLSAVVIVIWSGDEKSNPLYMLRNCTRYTICCRQPLHNEEQRHTTTGSDETCNGNIERNSTGLECGMEIGPTLRSVFGMDRTEQYVWELKRNTFSCFGLEDPEKAHVVEWTCVVDNDDNDIIEHHHHRRKMTGTSNNTNKKAYQDIDAMGSSSIVQVNSRRHVRCQIRAEHSTKVVEFVEIESENVHASEKKRNYNEIMLSSSTNQPSDKDSNYCYDEETIAIGFRLEVPTLSISIVDNAYPTIYGREILLCHFEKAFVLFSQGREGYHEMEVMLGSFQVDNHVQKSVHPVLIFCPSVGDQEPLLHLSAVRRLEVDNNTCVFRYAAIRLLEVEIYLDRRTAETISRFIQPLVNLGSGLNNSNNTHEKSPDWLYKLTSTMERSFGRGGGGAGVRTTKEIVDDKLILSSANSGRIYLEQLHLHPVRLSLTFTQESIDWNQSADTVMIFQFIRGMASIASAPIVFTSFVVGHVFESPQALVRIISTHYSSQLTKQIFGIIGSLAILGAPADFISNVGTGVRDFFYEPIQGAVHGPRQFIEGLEAGTQSLARGVFVGVVRGAANVTDVVNSNLAGLTADEDFIGERKAHQRMLTDAMSRGASIRTFSESLNLACASLARGVKSGALGIVEQPAMYASKHGPVGFLKGIGKAMVGVVVKPVVGFGDGVVLVMNHMSDATSKRQVYPKIPKRLRRALPSLVREKPNCVSLDPYDERAAKAQTIVTGGETLDDVYLGHVNIQNHLIIASEQCLWAIDRISCTPWCVSWREISHYRATDDRGVRIVVFSQTGLKTYIFQVENQKQLHELQKLLSLQLFKMANYSESFRSVVDGEPDSMSIQHIPGIKTTQVKHIFGSINNIHKRINSSTIKDEVDLIEQCFARVRKMSSDQSATYLKTLDEEAWNLVSWWGQVFTGLSSRRCVVAGIINGTKQPIQIKSAKLIEGGSLCYSIPTKEYDIEQGILNSGGVILFFGWGIVPNLVQAGNVYMCIESNAVICDLVDQKCFMTTTATTSTIATDNNNNITSINHHDPTTMMMMTGTSTTTGTGGIITNTATTVVPSSSSNTMNQHSNGGDSVVAFARAMPGYHVGFLEKSYDDSGWWAKYWLLVRSD